jgi:hypothetical protein
MMVKRKVVRRFTKFALLHYCTFKERETKHCDYIITRQVLLLQPVSCSAMTCQGPHSSFMEYFSDKRISAWKFCLIKG